MRLGNSRGAPVKWVLMLLCFVFFSSVLLGVVLRNFGNPFNDAVAAYAAAVGNDAVNDAVKSCIEDNGIDYSDIITLKENSNGNVTSMTANGLKISSLKTDFTAAIQRNIENRPLKSVKIPVGSAQKNPLFAAFGPKMKIKISPSAITKIDFHDEFSDAGINQVRHTIFLDVCISVTVTAATARKSYDCSNSILIADTIIVGGVPNYYGALGGRIVTEAEKS